MLKIVQNDQKVQCEGVGAVGLAVFWGANRNYQYGMIDFFSHL